MDVIPHTWELEPSEAIVLQHKLARLVVHRSKGSAVCTIAGVDVSYRNGWAYAVTAVFSYPELRFLEYARVRRRLTFPYVPGLLSFREGPAVLDVIAALKTTPDMLMFDGHGVAHPRRFGLASHIGVILDIPSVGCAKTKLCGDYAEPGVRRGDYSYLVDRGETVGAVVRTRAMVKPVFVSIGHRVDLGTSVAVVLKCCDRYRLPEPTRWADRLTRGNSAQAKEHLRLLIAARTTHIQSPD